ncbi:hypothetical protein CEW89_16675 [Celeribacter ethanolicus]|uniref:Anti-sigma K factor RskA C-terminal domain-containing protein n=1 Tax=Celeribacter ethanolicus TaxID=1758178 RepID=A0A291GFU5_9RHOB|nr:anti-sigma factor [Celeribacter ethanolicus]ATG49057.1 hypothetical protein CEW89_16675 [Celeribacter ethanolicus]
MTQSHDDDEMLAAELALGLLEGDERARVQRRAASDPGFAGLVRGWETRLSTMADLPPVTAPPSVKAALMADLFPETVKPPIWKRLGVWQALTGGAMAVALVLALMLTPLSGPNTTGPLYTAEITSDIGDFRVVAVIDKSRQEVILTRTLGGAPEGRILQVWAHGPDEPAQSVGLWPAGESIRLPLPPDIAAVRGTLTLGVSEEPPGGSLTGSPSGRVFGTVDIANVTGAG